MSSLPSRHPSPPLPHLFSLPGADTKNLSVVLTEIQSGHASKHLLEVLLKLGHVLAVPNNLQQILISNKVEPEEKMVSIKIG